MLILFCLLSTTFASVYNVYTIIQQYNSSRFDKGAG